MIIVVFCTEKNLNKMRLFSLRHNEAIHSYKQLIKTPKLHSIDTGMMCAIRGLNREPLSFYHYRDMDKVEVDIIIENAQGDCFAVPPGALWA